MRVAVRIWRMAVLVGCCAIFAPATKGDDWKAEHDAGWNAYKAGQLDEAERHLLEAEKQARVLGDNDPKLATTLDHLAWVLCSEGKSDKAEPLAKSALAIREKALGADHPDVVSSLNTLACIYDAEGRTADARPIYARCLAAAEKAYGPEHGKVAEALDNLAAADHLLGEAAEAEAMYKRALAAAREASRRQAHRPGSDPLQPGCLVCRPGKVRGGRAHSEAAARNPGEGPGCRSPGCGINTRRTGVDVVRSGKARRG